MKPKLNKMSEITVGLNMLSLGKRILFPGSYGWLARQAQKGGFYIQGSPLWSKVWFSQESPIEKLNAFGDRLIAMEGPWRTGILTDILKRKKLEQVGSIYQADQLPDMLSWLLFGSYQFDYQEVKNQFSEAWFCGHDDQGHKVFGDNFVHEVYPGYVDHLLRKDYYTGLVSKGVHMCIDTFHLGRYATGGKYCFEDPMGFIKELGSSIKMLHFQAHRGKRAHSFLFQQDVDAFLKDKEGAKNPLRAYFDHVLQHGDVGVIIVEMANYPFDTQLQVIGKIKNLLNI